METLVQVKTAYNKDSNSYYAWSSEIAVTARGLTELLALSNFAKALKIYYTLKDNTQNYKIKLVL